jgi:hypothetical protein
MDDGFFLNESPENKKFEKKPVRLVPYCTSHPCAGDSKGIRKENIKGNPTFCPDCQHALFYHREIIDNPQKFWRRDVAMGD